MLAGGRRPLGEARTQPCLRGAALLREGCRAERPAGAEARAVALVGAERPDALAIALAVDPDEPLVAPALEVHQHPERVQPRHHAAGDPEAVHILDFDGVADAHRERVLVGLAPGGAPGLPHARVEVEARAQVPELLVARDAVPRFAHAADPPHVGGGDALQDEPQQLRVEVVDADAARGGGS